MTLQRIFTRYDANNDAGPVTWADIALANEVNELRSEIERLKAAPAPAQRKLADAARIAGLETAVEELTAERDAQKRRGDNFWQMYRSAANMLEAERDARKNLENIMDRLCSRLEELA